MSEDGRPIIIKRRKHEEHEAHGGAWKVAYADLVTALMALFIVLWVLAQSDEVKINVARHFQNPVGFKDGGMATPLGGGSHSGEPTVLEDVQPVPDTNKGDHSADKWREHAKEIRGALEKFPGFSKYRDQIEMTLTPEGLRIDLLESDETPLFQVGRPELNPEAMQLFSRIAKEFQNFPNFLVIEGHTDSLSFGDDAEMTNWELSTGRAHTARRMFESAGLDPARVLEVRGFADRQLYNPDNPADSRNRRISITLLTEESVRERQKRPKETVLPWLER